MVVIMQPDSSEDDVRRVVGKIESHGMEAHVSRDVCPLDRVVNVNGVEIGKGLVFIAGPCSVEDEDTTLRIAEEVRRAGAK